MVFRADVEELDNVLAYVESILDEKDISPKTIVGYLVAVEEIFVNIASYAYNGETGDANIDVIVDDNCIRTTFVDGGIEFNPLAKSDPDITAPVEEREIGGLGIYMVKKSMDGIEYERKDGKNILSFWKNY